MRGNSKLVLSKNIRRFAAVFILISSFAGCTAGSCLSYGHSCWGAHGKRSGVPRAQENPSSDGKRISPPFDERWLLSRLVNRQLMQIPLGAKLRARMFVDRPPQLLNNEILTSADSADIKNSAIEDKFRVNPDARDFSKIDRRIQNLQQPDVLPIPKSEGEINEDDQAIKIGLYKLLRNIDEKL